VDTNLASHFRRDFNDHCGLFDGAHLSHQVELIRRGQQQ
jgi:hypothetical protein